MGGGELLYSTLAIPNWDSSPGPTNELVCASPGDGHRLPLAHFTGSDLAQLLWAVMGGEAMLDTPPFFLGRNC